MTRRWLVCSVAATVAAAWLAPAFAAGQEAASEPEPTTFRTPWGDPDLQGVWSYATFTPLQRPAEFAGRELLTPEEVAAQNLADATRATSERRAELSAERDLALAYDQVWWDRGRVDRAHVAHRGPVRRPASAPDADGRAAARGRTRAARRRPLRFLGRPAAAGAVHDLPAGAAGAVRLQQRVSGLPEPRAGRHSQRDDPRRARRAARRASAHRRAHPPVERRRARPLGRRHPRGRDHALPRRHDVAGVPGHPRPARGGAVHPHRRRHHRVPLHDSRRGDVPRAPSRWSCPSSALPATSSTSTRATRGTTGSPTRCAASGSWRRPRRGRRRRASASAPTTPSGSAGESPGRSGGTVDVRGGWLTRHPTQQAQVGPPSGEKVAVA